MATYKAIIDDPPQSMLSQATTPPPIPLRRPRRAATEAEKEAIRMKKAANKLAKEKGILPPNSMAAATAKILASLDPVTQAIEKMEAKTSLAPVTQAIEKMEAKTSLAPEMKTSLEPANNAKPSGSDTESDSSEDEVYFEKKTRPKPKKLLVQLSEENAALKKRLETSKTPVVVPREYFRKWGIKY